MGFPTQLALRAVEATNGDLQRAIDWVLQNSASVSGNPPIPAVNTKPAPVPKRVEPDLLDFGPDDEVAAPRPAALAAMPTMPAKPPSHVADFADFGEFESALPATSQLAARLTPTANTASTATTTASPSTGALSASLADLYKKPVPKATSPSGMTINSNGGTVPHTMQPLQLSKTSASYPKNAQNTGRVHVRAAVRTSPRADASALGLPVFDFPTTNSPKPNAAVPASITRGVPSGNGCPEPPPMQAALQSQDGPPPPSPPPKSNSPKEIPHGNGVLDSGVKGHEDSPSNETERKERKEVVEEEEDPFAALSMMALSSASGSKKATVSAVGASANAKDLNTSGSSTMGDSFVDDLLG